MNYALHGGRTDKNTKRKLSKKTKQTKNPDVSVPF